MELTFGELVAATGAKTLSGDAELRLCGVGTDSRRASAGELFAALSGPRFEGHRYAADAVERGARAVLLPESAADAARDLAQRVAVALVPDVLDGLWDLARWHRSRLTATVVGITGSSGKTTTKGITARLLAERLRVAASPLSYNNQVGVPLTLFLAGEATEALVVELGTSGPGEIERLSQLAAPHVGVLTNIGPAHLEGLGSMEGVAREKTSLGAALRSDGVLVHDANCRFAPYVRARTGARLVDFAVDGDAAFQARDLYFHDGGTSFRLIVAPEWAGSGPRELDVASPLLGTHNVQNLLAALAACRAVGLELEEVLPAVRDLEGGRQRMERHEFDGLTVFDDAYNANPASAAAAVRVLGGLHGFRRRVLVLGEMLELGTSSDELHREVGRLVARSAVDLFVAVGPRAQPAAEGAREAGLGADQVRTLASAELALTEVPGWVEKGDVVLVKASRALALERLVDRLAQRFGRGGGRRVGAVGAAAPVPAIAPHRAGTPPWPTSEAR